MSATEVIAIIAVLIILPKIVLDFVRKTSLQKKEAELAKMKYQKEILELELEKQRNEIKLLQEECKKYDKIIEENS